MSGRPALGALLAGAFVLVAVGLEVVSGLNANSPVPAWAEKVAPLAWPQPARVAWWLVVAGAAAAFRLLLGRAGIPQRRFVLVVSVAPFLVFAAGVAVGADWATWH
ncbi:MAG: hypothetical protein ACRDZ3_07080 [Acidimicrobiia bacterium]